jgi:hypothetical protein
VCLNRARTDLCGGRAVMRVPTAKVIRAFVYQPDLNQTDPVNSQRHYGILFGRALVLQAKPGGLP